LCVKIPKCTWISVLCDWGGDTQNLPIFQEYETYIKKTYFFFVLCVTQNLPIFQENETYIKKTYFFLFCVSHKTYLFFRKMQDKTRWKNLWPEILICMIELNTETHVTDNVGPNVWYSVRDNFRYYIGSNVQSNVRSNVRSVTWNNFTDNVYIDLKNHTKLKW
jgi:hypothetical protein